MKSNTKLLSIAGFLLSCAAMKALPDWYDKRTIIGAGVATALLGIFALFGRHKQFRSSRKKQAKISLSVLVLSALISAAGVTILRLVSNAISFEPYLLGGIPTFFLLASAYIYVKTE